MSIPDPEFQDGIQSLSEPQYSEQYSVNLCGPQVRQARSFRTCLFLQLVSWKMT